MADGFIDNSKQVIDEKNKKIEMVLEAIGIHLEGEAKEELENSPRRIDTGLLRNSITHAISGEKTAITAYKGDKESKYGKSGKVPSGSYSGTAPDDPVDKKAVYIGTNVEYAPYVHEGTSRMSPNRYLKNACTRNAEQIKKYIEEGLKG